MRTGRQLWTFRTIPQAGDPGVDTWERQSWREAGNANVWAPMSADEELGYVYLPVSTPSNDFYGGHRPGDNLYGDSLVCILAEVDRSGVRVALIDNTATARAAAISLRNAQVTYVKTADNCLRR